LLVSLAHAGYDVVVGVVLYEAPEHDVESHEYDYDEEESSEDCTHALLGPGESSVDRHL